jgi:hypothetical protein
MMGWGRGGTRILTFFFFTIVNKPPFHRIRMEDGAYFNMVGENRENGAILPNRHAGELSKSLLVTPKIKPL